MKEVMKDDVQYLEKNHEHHNDSKFLPEIMKI